jgi:drug/metabolite transporter (DMT)-like permease
LSSIRPADSGKQSLAYLELLLAIAIWGGSFTAVKFCFPQFEPITFSFLRVSVASVFLLFLLAWRRGPRFRREDLPRLFILGVVGLAGNQLFWNSSLAKTTSAHGAVIMGLTPVFGAALTRLLYRERLAFTTWVFVGLSLLGVAVIFLEQLGGAGRREILLGDSLMLASAATWAFYSVFARPLLLHYSPLQLIAPCMAMGAVALFPVAYFWEGMGLWVLKQEAITWAAFGYMTVGALVVAFLLWYRALLRLPTVTVLTVFNLTPVLAGTIAWLALGEPFSGTFLAGGLMVVIGVLGVVQLGQRVGR